MRALTRTETESLHAAIEYVGEAWEPEHRHELDRLDEQVVSALPPDMVLIVAVWSVQAHECYECGLPAVFAAANDPQRDLCAVCAANAAVDGDEIVRTVPLD